MQLYRKIYKSWRTQLEMKVTELLRKFIVMCKKNMFVHLVTVKRPRMAFSEYNLAENIM